VQKEVSAENMSLFSKVLTRVIDKSRLQDLVPILLDDVNGRMEGWGRTGRIDPFVDVYNVRARSLNICLKLIVPKARLPNDGSNDDL